MREPATPVSIPASVTASLDLATVLDAGLDKATETIHADGGWIGLGDASSLAVVCHHGISDECAAAVAGLPADEGVTGLVLRGGEAVVVEDPAVSRLVPRPLLREGVATLLASPLEIQSSPLGLVVLVTRAPRTYSADDIRRVRAACDELAPAIERAILFREQLDRVERQRLLLEAAETVNRSLDSFSLETTILAEATRIVRAPRSALLVVRGDVLVAKETYGFGDTFKQLFVVPLEGSPFGRAVVSGETVAIGEVSPRDVPETGLASDEGYRAILAAPLQSYRGTSGVLALFYDAPQHFGDDEKMLLRTFAIQAAIALDNRRLMREKDQMAVRDGLTGVYNRSYLELTLERTTKELRRNGGVVSILFLDLDDMKKVNDTHGHPAGDRLLRDLAGLLTDSCRDTDIVARYGGDEFVVLMPGTDAAGARHVARKIGEAIERHNATRNGLPLSASLGMHTAGEADVDDLLHEADRRMYAMKRRGRRVT
jgi:diguanylate cyclase (GGDEF)-like protein